jgi:hypothetical protein
MENTMKKTIALASILAILAFPVFAQDGSWLFGQSLEDRKNDSAYQMETAGWDVRVYEFTPEANSKYTCIMAFASKGPVGFQCIPKAPQ